MRIIHIADIHWRGLSRHEEYTRSFSEFFKQCKNLKPDVIYVGGDIVHSKTQGISPELIDRLVWWFTSMAEICPVHIILGNHDGLMLNKDRQDAITPIISALDNKNIHLYKESGVYPTGTPGFNWCVFSCFDEAGWQKVRPIDGDVNIALFHGAVWGSKTDIDWEIEGDTTVDLFENFQFSLLGDIHRRQYLDSKKTIAYCGSAIQQNYGEDIGKGFLLWDIESSDKFTSKFYKIPHYSQFVTIDWAGTVLDTLQLASTCQDGARFRIRSKEQLTQADSQEISARLKSDMAAEEVVFKSENQAGSKKIASLASENDSNLRDISTHYSLFRDYFKASSLEQEERDDIKDLVDKYFSLVASDDETIRNARWGIESFNFDNLFSYGKDNRIDFAKNTGITGIFGKNTKGKSSIIGSLMYCLFNTTDRGPVKNLHIVNSRKNFAKASVDIKLNGERFRISRGTVKHTTRKNEVYASTSLDLQKLSKDGEVKENLTEEQRRETEKVLRKLIGTSDDFLMTSLACQGDMNRFISEGSTSRKSILTKFLDLEVFEKMSDSCKQDYGSIKALSRSIKKEDWTLKISEEKVSLKELESSLKELKVNIKSSREDLADLRNQISQLGFSSRNCYTISELSSKKNEIKSLVEKIELSEETKISISTSIIEKKEKLKRIDAVCNLISISELKDQRDAKIAMEKSLITLSSNYEKSLSNIKRLNESAERLNQVPCGDKFPTCMFIKSSHEDKALIESQEETIAASLQSLNDCKESLDIINNINPDEKIRKYEALFLKSKDLSGNINLDIEKESNLEESIIRSKEKLGDLEREKEKMSLFLETHRDEGVADIKIKINSVAEKIENFEKSQTKLIEKIAKLKFTIKSLEDDKENHNQLKRQMRIYDLFSQAVSKKGIPLQIMMSRLPVINREIESVLQGVVDFTVTLETDLSTNALDVYIDYGDSKRVIELASGMEKMIASLAIRVSLINTSSLTKTNMMIIDEGFGSLDATNLEACTRLLESLKKWFRNIIVISHVDAVKDCVDNSVEIIKKGKDSYVKFV